jgi:hypothetical protein
MVEAENNTKQLLSGTVLRIRLRTYVFLHPESRSVGHRYGSGFRSFYHQAKIVKKTLIPTVLRLLYDFLSMKNDINVPSKSNKQKKLCGQVHN